MMDAEWQDYIRISVYSGVECHNLHQIRPVMWVNEENKVVGKDHVR